VKTLLLGLGNPILKDDSVGLRIVREFGKKKIDQDVDIEEACFANIDILEAIGSYDRLIIVDSIKTKGGKPGELHQLNLDDLRSTLHLSCPHDINLATTLELGKRLGMHIPEGIQIYAIEIEDNQTFSETCSPSVEEAIPRVVEEIARREYLEGSRDEFLDCRSQTSDFTCLPQAGISSPKSKILNLKLSRRIYGSGHITDKQ
jgi:hydrogenase maturation protease